MRIWSSVWPSNSPHKVRSVIVVVAKNDAGDDADDGDQREDDERRGRNEKSQSDVLRFRVGIEAVSDVLGGRILTLKRHRGVTDYDTPYLYATRVTCPLPM